MDYCTHLYELWQVGAFSQEIVLAVWTLCQACTLCSQTDDVLFSLDCVMATTVTNCQTVAVIRLSNCQTVDLYNCKTVKLSNCQTVYLSNCRTVAVIRLSNCRCHETVKLSSCQPVNLSNCGCHQSAVSGGGDVRRSHPGEHTTVPPPRGGPRPPLRDLVSSKLTLSEHSFKRHDTI